MQPCPPSFSNDPQHGRKTGLLDLPNELIVDILCHLEDIDDALHFARTCRRAHGILRNEQFYLDIMRSIIHHQYDVALSQLIEKHQSFVAFYETASPSQKEEYRRGTKSTADIFHWESTMSAHSHLGNDMVYDILARWQGLRVLQDLYLASELQVIPAPYYGLTVHRAARMAHHNRTDEHFRSRFSIILDPGKEWTCETVDCGNRSFDTEQKQRFYMALSYLWLFTEYRWLLSHHYNQKRFDWVMRADMDSRLPALIDEPIGFLKQGDRTMLEALDTLDVFEFLYLRLLPAHSSVIGTQLDVGDMRYNWHFQQEDLHHFETTRALQRASALLRVPDTIGIVARHMALQQNDQTPDGQPACGSTEFLREVNPERIELYFGDDFIPVFSVPASYLRRVSSVSMYDHLRREVRVKATLLLGIQEFCWSHRLGYVHYWMHEARGKVFWWAQSNAKAGARLRRWMEKCVVMKEQKR